MKDPSDPQTEELLEKVVTPKTCVEHGSR